MTSHAVAINEDYLEIVRRYAELAGMSVKQAIEHAVNQTLIPELSNYLSYDEETELDGRVKAANAILPPGWHFNVCSFCNATDPTLTDVRVGLNVGLDPLVPTYVSIEQAQSVRASLELLPTSGGKFAVSGEMGEPFMVQRRGRGLVFVAMDGTFSKPTGAKSSAAMSSVPRICDALDQIIEAARKEEEEHGD